MRPPPQRLRSSRPVSTDPPRLDFGLTQQAHSLSREKKRERAAAITAPPTPLPASFLQPSRNSPPSRRGSLLADCRWRRVPHVSILRHGSRDSQFFGRSGIDGIPGLKIQTWGTHLQWLIETWATRRFPVLWPVGYRRNPGLKIQTWGTHLQWLIEAWATRRVSPAEIPQRRRRVNRGRLPLPILLSSDVAAWQLYERRVFRLSSQGASPEQFAPEYGNHVEGEGNGQDPESRPCRSDSS